MEVFDNMERLFKDIFRQLLHDNSINAYKLSKDTGISEALISYWKNGKQLPKYDSLNLLCDYFNVSADYLLGRTDEQTITHSTSNINSNFVQGNGSVSVTGSILGSGSISTTIPTKQSEEQSTELSSEEIEILDIYRSLNVRNKNKFLSFILDIEKEN